MRKFFVVIGVGFLALFLQTAVLRGIFPASVMVPNLMLAIVAFLAFHEVSPYGALLSFLIGIQFDLASGVLLGPWAAAFVAVYGFLSVISQRMFVESSFSIVVAVFFSALVSHLVYMALLYQFSSHEVTLFVFSARMMSEAILSAVCAPLIFKLLMMLRISRHDRL